MQQLNGAREFSKDGALQIDLPVLETSKVTSADVAFVVLIICPVRSVSVTRKGHKSWQCVRFIGHSIEFQCNAIERQKIWKFENDFCILMGIFVGFGHLSATGSAGMHLATSWDKILVDGAGGWRKKRRLNSIKQQRRHLPASTSVRAPRVWPLSSIISCSLFFLSLRPRNQ